VRLLPERVNHENTEELVLAPASEVASCRGEGRGGVEGVLRGVEGVLRGC
jgi:hypothetical protein